MGGEGWGRGWREEERARGEGDSGEGGKRMMECIGWGRGGVWRKAEMERVDRRRDGEIERGGETERKRDGGVEEEQMEERGDETELGS